MAACGGAVQFDRGTDGATLSGSINGDATCDFTLRASKGQLMSASLDAPNGVEVIVIDPVEHALVPGDALTLPQNATYTVRVLQTRNAARQAGNRPFTLKLRVRAAAAATASAPATTPAHTATAGTLCDGSGTLTGGQANMSGRIAGYDTCDYKIAAKAGQTLNMLMDAPAGVEAFIVAPTEQPLVPDSPIAITANGTYEIRVGRTRNDARHGGVRDFSMVVTVE